MEATKRYIAEGTETGKAFWIVDTKNNQTIGLLDKTRRESINLVIDAMNQQQSNNAGSPMKATKQARVVVMSKATFDQAREALKMVKDWLDGERYADQDLPEICEKVTQAQAAMEATS